jgi:hypothetical protein
VKAVLWVLLLLAAVVIEAELIAWFRPLQRWLIRRAAAPLPKQQRDRYIEEWYRELEELPEGPLTRLSWVLFLVLRRGSLVRAVGPSSTASRSTSLRERPAARVAVLALATGLATATGVVVEAAVIGGVKPPSVAVAAALALALTASTIALTLAAIAVIISRRRA